MKPETRFKELFFIRTNQLRRRHSMVFTIGQTPSLKQSLLTKWKYALLIGGISAVATSTAFPALAQLVPPPEGLPLSTLLIAQTVNTFILATIASLVGVTFASQAGISELPILDSLWKRKFADAKSKIVSALVLGVPLGGGGLALIFLLDMIFASMGVSIIPEVVPKFTFIISGLMLGFQAGFYEEALLRLGLLSFIAWILKRWSWNLWGANIMSALLFGLGHIPVLLQVTQEATFLLITRTIVLNAVMGIIFGYCYIKRGYGSAVSAHFTANFINYGIIQPLLT